MRFGRAGQLHKNGVLSRVLSRSQRILRIAHAYTTNYNLLTPVIRVYHCNDLIRELFFATSVEETAKKLMFFLNHRLCKDNSLCSSIYTVFEIVLRSGGFCKILPDILTFDGSSSSSLLLASPILIKTDAPSTSLI